jgi:hypothetical protein
MLLDMEQRSGRLIEFPGLRPRTGSPLAGFIVGVVVTLMIGWGLHLEPVAAAPDPWGRLARSERISFAPGAESCIIHSSGEGRVGYVLNILSGQEMVLDLTGDAHMGGVYRKRDGQPVGEVMGPHWQGTVPSTGDYLVVVIGAGKPYTLKIDIPGPGQ